MEPALISSHGTLPGIAEATSVVLALIKPYDILCSSLELPLDHQECNYHTSNTRDVSGLDFEIDLPLYEYSPLPETGHIHLLNFAVKISDNKKFISGSLSQHSFDEAKKIGYKALSYAWGDPYRTHHILCMDDWNSDTQSRIPITANLADWFQHCKVGVYIFWIDAICINQADMVQRAKQVEQMREVYRNAKFVVAWVGSNPKLHTSPSAGSSSGGRTRDLKALLALLSLQNDIMTVELGLWNILFSTGDDRLGSCRRLPLLLAYLRMRYDILRGQLLKTYHLIKACKNLSGPWASPYVTNYRWHYTVSRLARSTAEHPYLTMLRRPYFTRRWVIQELGSAHSLGAITYQWDIVTLSLRLILRTIAWNNIDDTTENDELAAFRQLLAQTRMHTRGRSHKTPAIDFLQFATTLDAFDCQDPRDRIFALIGMYPQLQFKVNYCKSTEEVYKSFAVYLIHTQPQCLPMLLFCAVRHRSTLLPSWVPDWRVTVYEGHKRDSLTDPALDEAPQLLAECVQYIGVSNGEAERLAVAGLYVGFVAGRAMYDHDSGNRSFYLILTESRLFGILRIRQDIVLYPGDLLFDFGRIFVLRTTSGQHTEAELVASSIHIALVRFPDLQTVSCDDFETVDYSADEGPHNLKSINIRAQRELSRLREMSLTDDLVACIMGIRSTSPELPYRMESHVYERSVEFPISQCLTVFDIV